jgi:hypothetical protein
VSHHLNEGNYRATARVSMRREGNTTLNYATARSVAESSAAEALTLTDHARRLLNMSWLRTALPRDSRERTISRPARLRSSSSPGSRDCAARRRPCSRSPRMSEISTSVTAFARSQANSIGHGTGYANAPSASACATARSGAAPRPSRGPGSACSASSPTSWGASAPSWSRSSEPCCCSSCCTSSDPDPGGTSVARHAHPRPAPSRARSASA